MEIRSITPEELEFVELICLDPSIWSKWREEMNPCMERRKLWLKKMMKKGLEILIAFEDPRIALESLKGKNRKFHSMVLNGKFPMGLIEYLPIEYAVEPVIGEKSYFLNCLWVIPPFWKKGIGKNLVNAAIENTQSIGGMTVLAYEGDQWFGWFPMMPSEFFKKFGFKEVDRDGSRILLYNNLGSGTTPKFIQPKKRDIKTQTGTLVEALFNDQCPWSYWLVTRIQKYMKRKHTTIKLINTGDRKIIKEYGLSRGVCINGIPIVKKMASWKEIQSIIRNKKPSKE
ncbi:MAG: GNAT family N-acetyltransferase [Candidatus Hodarchaeota archaeon]